MIHKISQFCDKIDSIKKMADRLRDMKYGPVKSNTGEIDNLIQTIQADCLLVANDKGKYEKLECRENGFLVRLAYAVALLFLQLCLSPFILRSGRNYKEGTVNQN